MSGDEELRSFKRIDFPAFLGQHGYRRDDAESTGRSVKMRRGAVVLILRPEPDGTWSYFNTGDDRDNGDITNWVQTHQLGRQNLGEVRKYLRPYVGLTSPPTPMGHVFDAPEFDLPHVRQRWDRAGRLSGGHPYLESRGLSRTVLERYSGNIRIDRHGNALFGHTDDVGSLTGYEIRGLAFQGFSRGGSRTLARFCATDSPSVVAICESGVNALSLAQLSRAGAAALYLSTGGTPGSETLAAITAVAARYPAAPVVIAFDNDQPGARLAARVSEVLADPARVRYRPPVKANDWNDLLQPCPGL